jgi:hypothetical protein
MIAQMERLGAPPEVIKRVKGEQEDVFWLYPENADAVNMFLRCSRQLRYTPDGTLLGLDYAAVDVVLRAYDMQDVFPKIQSIELGAINAIQDMRKRR